MPMIVIRLEISEIFQSEYAYLSESLGVNHLPTKVSMYDILDLIDHLGNNPAHITNTELAIESTTSTNDLNKRPSRQKKKAENAKVIIPADAKKWTVSPFPWLREIERINIEIFKNNGFRPNQRAIINATLSDKDIFALMPTGYGKSLCYQLPAVYSQGLTFVISPLIALIHDQVNQMNLLGIKTIALHSNKEIRFKISQASEDKRIKLVYTTPETILSQNVFQSLARLHAIRKIERFVIDEAHCVSKWGNDFRKQYLELKKLRENFSTIPIQTYTATASREVVEDVINYLGLRNIEFFKASFNRSNLFIQVFEKSKELFKNKLPHKNDIILSDDESDKSSIQSNRRGKSKKRGKTGTREKKKKAKSNKLTKTASDIANMIRVNYRYSSGIIYCTTKTQCDDLSKFLSIEFDGKVKVASYHAGKPESVREKILKQFMNDEITVVVATIAFGMGINKSDIRYVIHYNLPKSVEDYYQEIGRAGRDGLPAICTLFYDPSDKSIIDFFIKKDTKGSQAKRVSKKIMMYKLMSFCEVI